MSKIYEIKNASTGDMICRGFAKECADAVGLNVSTFYGYASGNKPCSRYAFEVLAHDTPMAHMMADLRCSRREVAKFCGVSMNTVGVWARGEARPFKRNIEKLCEYFGCTKEELEVDSNEHT